MNAHEYFIQKIKEDYIGKKIKGYRDRPFTVRSVDIEQDYDYLIIWFKGDKDTFESHNMNQFEEMPEIIEED